MTSRKRLKTVSHVHNVLSRRSTIKISPDDTFFDRIEYKPALFNRQTKHTESITVYGIDTEAYSDGRCFMICTSEGDIWTPKEFPASLFGRKYRQQHFVAYNLRYDLGALIQRLPRKTLEVLRETGAVEYRGYKYRILGYKYLAISRNGHTCHFYDLFGFFLTSLDKASEEYLGRKKIEIETKTFSRSYVRANWDKLAEYCIRDCELARDLARILISHFEGFGVYPRKLYSTAYVSWQYFRTHCPYIHVKRYWDNDMDVLRAAVASYNGGKFEVTRKGVGEFHEYDIVSAYPSEIANLVDIRKCRVIRESVYRKHALYSYYDCSFKIPQGIPSPVVVKSYGLCTFPNGLVRRVVTKGEYEYLRNCGVSIHIYRAWHLVSDNMQYPYREEIERLTHVKTEYKKAGDKLRYHTVKIFLNSLYGKLCQLIDDNGILKAGSSWNPIYASEITARCRIRVSEMQARFPSVVAVHTDSVISTQELPIRLSDGLGQWEHSASGAGLILGTGVYQIGEKSRFRGFRTKTPLLELIPKSGREIKLERIAPISWREAVFQNMSLRYINRFVKSEKNFVVDFDRKRLWLDDWTDFAEVRERTVDSLPLILLDESESRFAV